MGDRRGRKAKQKHQQQHEQEIWTAIKTIAIWQKDVADIQVTADQPEPAPAISRRPAGRAGRSRAACL